MHAIQVARPGDPEVLEWREIDTPEPAEGEILVAMAAAGLNYIETYHRKGIYARELPFVPGGEGAGTCRRSGTRRHRLRHRRPRRVGGISGHVCRVFGGPGHRGHPGSRPRRHRSGGRSDAPGNDRPLLVPRLLCIGRR